MTNTVVQHSVEVVGTAAVSVDFAAVDHSAGLDVVWETLDAELVCIVPVADTVACSDVGVGVVLQCTVVDIVAPVVLDCTVVDIVLGAPVCCTLGDIADVFGCTVDCHCGAGPAFAVAY